MIDIDELKKFVDKASTNIENKKIFTDIQTEEIIFLKENNLKQKAIIEFLFNKYPELKSSYDNDKRIQTLKSLLSKIKIKKEKQNRKTAETKKGFSTDLKPIEKPSSNSKEIIAEKPNEGVNKFLNLSKIENTTGGLIESENRKNIK